MITLPFWGCSERPSFDPGDECELNTECLAPLVCRLGRCRIECRAQRDCFAGLECVRDEDHLGACQLQEEASCTLASECPDVLVCRHGRCTNACESDVDCSPGARCEDDGSGSLGCRDAADRECMLNSDCMDVRLICAPDGRCREPCHGDRDCRDGTVCETTTSPTMCVLPEDRVDAGFDAGPDAGPGVDGGMDAGFDAGGMDAGFDAGGVDAGFDAGGVDAGFDAGGMDAGFDAGSDAGIIVMPPMPPLISAGFEHTCALAQTPPELRCWGRNMEGQLGDTTSGTNRPTAQPVVGVSGVSIVAAGSFHSCAATATGDLYCWGDNASGQLGRAAGAGDPTPGTVTGLPVGAIDDLTAGVAHTCAITGGQLFCWGANGNGQLGDGTTAPRTSPTLVTLPRPAVQVSTYSNHTCVVLDDGAVRCFGDSFNGQCGTGVRATNVLNPAPVMGLGPSAQVAAGSGHTCAIEVTGQVRCWGARDLGQCGDIGALIGGPYADTTTAVAVRPTIVGQALQISAGSTHSCVRTSTRLYCWGDNFFLQSGLIPAAFGEPVEITAAGVPDEVGAGGAHSCFIRGLDPYCFGRDNRGQLGDGVIDPDRRAPAVVLYP